MRLSLSAVRGNRHFLEQGLRLLERLPPEHYATPSRLGWAPVGSQFRHILDHYRSFLRGWAEGRVDYDARDRDRLVETDRAEAARVARLIIERLELIHVEDGDRILMVQMDCGGNDGVPDWRPSSVGRELQFLVSHTVHHYALIRLLLLDQGIEAGADFGTAPSTLAWQHGVPARSAASAPSASSASSASSGNSRPLPSVSRESHNSRPLAPETPP
jgi:uncharacterized damage-inducible protein DinB